VALDQPLHLACHQGHVNIVSLLLAAGANIEMKDHVRVDRISLESFLLLLLSACVDGHHFILLVQEAIWIWSHIYSSQELILPVKIL
jgi:hypothetical protein